MPNLTRVSEAKYEYLHTACWLAELELEDSLRSNRQLRYTLEREGPDMKASDRVLLQARLIESNNDLATKTRVAKEKLDEMKRVTQI